MLSHVTIGTNDLPRTVRFYDAVLAPLGIELTMAIWQHGLIRRNPSGGAEKAK